MPDTVSDGLAAIAAAVGEAVPEPTRRQSALLLDLERHVGRLAREEFQLAVLGQVKRGKSTLVNALCGRRVLATGVLPLTAAPTFLRGGAEPSITVVENGGGGHRHASGDMVDLIDRVAAATTDEERASRAGADGVRRVEVTLPAAGLLDSVVLIDTPGVGSNDTRSTGIALAALPECDAALFVLSVDPPFTQAEADYLAAVAAQTDLVVFVLNKVDLVDAVERADIAAYVASMVAGVEGVPSAAKLFPISAKRALQARLSGDEAAVEESGLAALEAYVRSGMVEGKRAVVGRAVARRIATIVAAIEEDALIQRRALMVPLAELDSMISALREAELGFARKGDLLRDRFAGEWRRTDGILERACAQAEARIAARLDAALADLPDGADAALASEVFGRVLAGCFEEEARDVADLVNGRLAEAGAEHRSHFAELARAVREASNAIVGIPVPVASPVAFEEVAPAFEAGWLGTAEIDTFGSLAMDGFSALLPVGRRRARERRRMREAAGRALRRNATRMHWSAKRSVDDAFRALMGAVPQAVDEGLGATRGILDAARRRRLECDASHEDGLRRSSRTLDRLAQARRALGAML